DNVVNRCMAAGLLKKRGYIVEAVENGQEALQALDCQQFDLVLMDVEMPEMDGLDATREIRRQEEGTGEHLPIVAMTAHAMSGDRERCLAAGMDDYIQKPVNPKQLFAAMEQWLKPRQKSPSEQNGLAAAADSVGKVEGGLASNGTQPVGVS